MNTSRRRRLASPRGRGVVSPASRADVPRGRDDGFESFGGGERRVSDDRWRAEVSVALEFGDAVGAHQGHAASDLFRGEREDVVLLPVRAEE